MSGEIDERLARLERVFGSIADAWASAGTDPSTGGGRPATNQVDTSTSFIRKLQGFAGTLDADEQKDLAVLMAAAAAGAKQAVGTAQTDRQRAASTFLQALETKFTDAGDGLLDTDNGTELTPTWTITTVTTTIASHPIIGCLMPDVVVDRVR